MTAMETITDPLAALRTIQAAMIARRCGYARKPGENHNLNRERQLTDSQIEALASGALAAVTGRNGDVALALGVLDPTSNESAPWGEASATAPGVDHYDQAVIQDGRSAALSDAPHSSNPYDREIDAILWASWEYGWHQGLFELEQNLFQLEGDQSEILFEGFIPQVNRTYRVTTDAKVLRIYRSFGGQAPDWHLEGTVLSAAHDWEEVLRRHVMLGGEGLFYFGQEG
jgi:hypothetical protein